MNRFRGLAISIAILSMFNAVLANAEKKITLDEETLKILEEHYLIFNQRNMKELAKREIARSIFYGQDNGLFQSKETVVMPICDEQRPPFEWKYIAPSENERVLKFIGARDLDSQFLRWTDSIWIRAAGNPQKFREGMYCGQPYANSAENENFAIVDIDRSFSQNIKSPDTPIELIDAALLQLASKFISRNERKMRGEVSLGVSASLHNIHLGLEIWCFDKDGAQKLASSWSSFEPSATPETLIVDAEVPAGKQAHLILRLDPHQRDSAASGKLSGRLFIIDARLYSN